jgi:Xaa-Pro aminopeptidase
MKNADLDALIVFGRPGALLHKTGSFRYLSNVPEIDVEPQMIVLPADDEPTAIVGIPREVRWMKELGWIDNVRSIPGRSGEGFDKEAANILRERGIRKGKIGLDPLEELPVGVHLGLKQALREVQFAASDIIVKLRMVKSEAEIAALKEAAKLLDVAHDALKENIRAGKKEYEVAAAIEYAVKAKGARKVFVGPPFAHGLDSKTGEMFGTFCVTNREFKKGEMFRVPIELSYEGYWGQIQRTGSIGLLASEQKKLFDAVQKANELAVKNLKEGTVAGDIYKATRDFLKGTGIVETISRLGHGLGLEYMEQPEVWETTSARLKNNMVIEVHPNVNVPYLGAASVGDPYLITPRGPERLTRSSNDLIVI